MQAINCQLIKNYYNQIMTSQNPIRKGRLSNDRKTSLLVESEGFEPSSSEGNHKPSTCLVNLILSRTYSWWKTTHCKYQSLNFIQTLQQPSALFLIMTPQNLTSRTKISEMWLGNSQELNRLCLLIRQFVWIRLPQRSQTRQLQL